MKTGTPSWGFKSFKGFPTPKKKGIFVCQVSGPNKKKPKTFW